MKYAWLLLVVVGLSGCASREARVVGRWEGDVNLSEKDRKAPLANLANAFAASVSLDVKPDHTFDMTVFVVPTEGTWKLEGDRVILTSKEVFGFKATDSETNKTMVLRLSADGKTLQPVTDQAFLFTRVEPPSS